MSSARWSPETALAVSDQSRLHRAPAIVGVVAVIVTAVVLVWMQRQDDSGTPPADARPPTTAVSSAPSPDAPGTIDGDQLSWTSANGVALPVSTTHGPRDMHAGRASGFSHTEVGAAFAAAHLVAMTSPSVGPDVFEPTLADQVVGANATTMAGQVAEQYRALRLSAGVQEGRAVPGANANVVGFALDAYDADAGHATVRLVLTSPELRRSERMLELPITLTWSDGDWRLLAPPNGGWDSLAQVATTVPAGLMRYDEVA